MKVVGQFPRVVREIENTWITLSDGCRLAARIWLPADAEDDPVPVILEYLPYRKRDGTAVRDELTHPYFAGHGYGCIRVDMRGNGDSDGLMWDEYLKQEQDDALEVIDWATQQTWCSGTVGMIGISWGGFNGLQVAARGPEALKAIVTICFTDDRYADDIHYKGGCLLNENLGWGATMLSFSSRPPDPALVGESWRDTWLNRLENQPLLAPEWLRHARRDDFWKHGSVCEDFGAIQAAVFAVGGWADAYSNAVPRVLEGLTAPTIGLIGPWLHKYPHFAVPGPQIGFLQECLRWWDQWLKGEDTGIMVEPKYRAFMQETAPPQASYEIREGRWIGEDGWPASGVSIDTFVLNASGIARSAAAEEPLTVNSPQSTGAAGGEYCAMWAGPELPTDQGDDDAGSLVFDSEPLERRIEIFGAPVVELEIAADRPQAFVAIRLCDVSPDGKSARITFGLLNLAHRNGHETPEVLTPGERQRVSIQLDDIAYALPPGHRLRVAVSTAYWPMIWPSPEAATVTIFSGASELLLPLRAPRPETLRPFEPAETAPPHQADCLRPEQQSRTVETDPETGEVVTRILGDFGEFKEKNHGLASGSVCRETYRIDPDAPLTARVDIHWTQTLHRDDWSVRTEAFSAMTADAETFYITGRLEAYEGDQLVFARDWSESVARDHL